MQDRTDRAGGGPFDDAEMEVQLESDANPENRRLSDNLESAQSHWLKPQVERQLPESTKVIVRAD